MSSTLDSIFQTAGLPSDQTEVLIVNAPLTLTHSPLMAGAVLKSIAEKAGFKCTTVDFNVLMVQYIVNHQYKFQLLDFFNDNKLHNECKKDIDEFFTKCLEVIKKCNPKILGISVFTLTSRAATTHLCTLVRQHLPDIQIIIGGAGIAAGGAGDTDYAKQLKQQNLIDDYITGDAELSFYEYLKGHKNYQGINSSDWNNLTMSDLASLPYPNYDDYKWHLYKELGLPITGSRGCVRNCKFCDYIEHWKKFTWRTADDLFAEIITQQQKYNISHFHFSDSLINGNMKEYKLFVTKLAQHNATCEPQKRITWTSYFIFRSVNQFSEELWRLTALSGAVFLTVGIETFDEQIRIEIGKPFSNADIDFSLDMAEKYNIKVMLMFIVGHISETNAHIKTAKKWLDDRVRYKNNIIINFVSTLVITPNTWYDRHQDKLGIMWINKDSDSDLSSAKHVEARNWMRASTGNTPEKRSQWMLQLLEHSKKLGFDSRDTSFIQSWLEDLDSKDTDFSKRQKFYDDYNASMYQ